jgi:hypothetical protein
MEHNEIKSFTDQSAKNKAMVNINKEAEERVYRILDNLANVSTLDQQLLIEGRKHILMGFMLVNRSIFQPERIELPEDTAVVDDPEPQLPPVIIGRVERHMDLKNHREIVKDAAGHELTAVGPNWHRTDELKVATTAHDRWVERQAARQAQ